MNLRSADYYSQTVIPKIYCSMLTKVKKSLDSTDYLSFTVDAWTSKNQLHSLLALTVHYIDEQFLPKYYVLDAQPIVGSHRAENYVELLRVLDLQLKFTTFF
ncbi:hypothetical protein ACQ4LE_001883 [Meloidogyne hapla]